MKHSEITLMRLQNQKLLHSEFKTPQEVVHWLGGVQGQNYADAKWAVGLRLPGSTEAEIEKSINEKFILRTWLMRGTLHLVAAEDIRWMLQLLSPRIIKNNKRRYKELELDEETLKHSNQVLKDSLNDAKELDRKELRADLEKNGISTEGQRFPYMLQRASLDGLICQCGMKGNTNSIFMSMDQIPLIRKPDDSLAELARRYFKSRSPATISDFIWWSGLLAADARAGIESIESELKVNDKLYLHSETNPVPDVSSPFAHLLPTYDEYLFGYRDRSAAITSISEIILKNRYQPTIAMNGEIVGIWKRSLNNNSVSIEQELFITLNNGEDHALKEVKLLYGKFLGMDVA